MEFSRQEYWNGLPFPSPGDLPDPEIEPTSALAVRFFTTEPPWKPTSQHVSLLYSLLWLNNAPLDGYTTICVSIYPLRDIWVVSTFDSVNNAAMNMLVHVFSWTTAFSSLEYLPKSRITGSCVWQFYASLFEELPNCFPRQLNNFTPPHPAMCEGSNFLTFYSTLVTCH